MSASKSRRHDGNDFVNRWDFRCRRNDDRVDAAVTVGGRLFQALVPAVEKDRSPSVDLRVTGTTNADELEDLRRCRDFVFCDFFSLGLCFVVSEGRRIPNPERTRKEVDNLCIASANFFVSCLQLI